MHVGIPVVPVSSAYSLMSKDFAKLKISFSQISPGAIYIADQKRFAPALAAISGRHDASVIVGGAGGVSAGAIPFDELSRGSNDTAVDRAFDAVLPDTLAKILFTSGSTGLVDWLPWNHTFGGNHNFNLILRNGGTLYIDGGRPLPGLFEQTLDNLREIAPTIYFNVPRGFDMMVSALRVDEILRRTFFSRLQVIFCAAAALPQDLWDTLHELARHTVGAPVPLVSSWGSTETAPAATNCHFQADHAGVIGLPVPGTELKLVPSGNNVEARVRGPNVTQGYWKQPETTAAAFDSEGFYSIGDAVRLVDEAHAEKGLLFALFETMRQPPRSTSLPPSNHRFRSLRDGVFATASCRPMRHPRQ